MSAVATEDVARDWVKRLEDIEIRRSGAPIREARARVARRVGVPAGTLENLRRDRMKGIRAWVYTALHRTLIAEIKREIAAYTHELQIALNIDGGADPAEIAEILAGLDELKTRLNAHATCSALHGGER